jgi:hypothetical protein
LFAVPQGGVEYDNAILIVHVPSPCVIRGGQAARRVVESIEAVVKLESRRKKEKGRAGRKTVAATCLAA